MMMATTRIRVGTPMQVVRLVKMTAPPATMKKRFKLPQEFGFAFSEFSLLILCTLSLFGSSDFSFQTLQLARFWIVSSSSLVAPSL